MMWRRALIALTLSLTIAAAYLALRDAPLIGTIEGQTLNLRFRLRGPLPPPTEIVILAIDDRTIDTLRRFPLPRSALAEAVRRLVAANAAVIGMDLLLLEREQPSDGITLGPGDRELHDALRASGRCVLAVAFDFGPASRLDGEAAAVLGRSALTVVHRSATAADMPVMRATGASLPFAPLREVVAHGHVNVPADEDGSLRHLHLVVEHGEDLIPAFPIEVLRRFLRLEPGEVVLRTDRGLAVGRHFVPADWRLRVPINFLGPSGTVPTHSLIDLLQGRLAPELFAGRMVLIGANALGVGDTFVTPFSAALPGVEVLATVIANILAGDVLEHSTRALGWDLVAIVALGMVGFAMAQLPSRSLAMAATAGLLIAWFTVAQLAFTGATMWLSTALPSAAVLVNAAAAAVGRSIVQRRMRRAAERERENLSRYVSPVIVDFLAASEAPSFDDREQMAAILFVDLAGYTGRMERMKPADTVSFLRNLHSRIERAVLAHGGVIEHFMGDGAMVIFGVPAPSAEDSAQALACARELAADLRGWSEQLVLQGEEPLGLGIGIHYGPVAIARLGGQVQRHLTAAGDTVNVASRLEALTRTHAATIVISPPVVAAVQASGRSDLLAGFEQLPAQNIRGRREPLTIWVARELGAP